MERKWPDYYEDSLRSTTIGLCREKGWLILLTCSTCGHGGRSGAVIEWDELARFDQSMTMATLASTARFERCGHKGAWIDHRNDPASVLAGKRPSLPADAHEADHGRPQH